MIELEFAQFHEQQYRENRYELYVLSNELGDVLYVGISRRDIWERWFGWGGHMTWDGKVIYGESPIGVKIEYNLPQSLRWKIQLWTLEDCIAFCQTELSGSDSELTIQEIEPVMIQKLSPALNRTFNLKPGKDRTPKSQKELDLEREADELYNLTFNNKK